MRWFTAQVIKRGTHQNKHAVILKMSFVARALSLVQRLGYKHKNFYENTDADSGRDKT